MPYYGKGIVKATGLENPAKAEHVEISVKHSVSMPGVQMPGEKTKKIVDPVWQGQDVAGEADHTSVKGPKTAASVKGWSMDGMKRKSLDGVSASAVDMGYGSVKMPVRHDPAPAPCTYQDDPKYGKNEEKGPGKQTLTEKANVGNEYIRKGGGSSEQDVKGKNNPARRGEAKQVAGVS